MNEKIKEVSAFVSDEITKSTESFRQAIGLVREACLVLQDGKSETRDEALDDIEVQVATIRRNFERVRTLRSIRLMVGYMADAEVAG